jgi:hypothetical protein
VLAVSLHFACAYTQPSDWVTCLIVSIYLIGWRSHLIRLSLVSCKWVCIHPWKKNMVLSRCIAAASQRCLPSTDGDGIYHV